MDNYWVTNYGIPKQHRIRTLKIKIKKYTEKEIILKYTKPPTTFHNEFKDALTFQSMKQLTSCLAGDRGAATLWLKQNQKLMLRSDGAANRTCDFSPNPNKN